MSEREPTNQREARNEEPGDEPGPTSEPAPTSSPDPAKRPLVLLAEDEPLASMALRAQLEALDFRVLGPARNGDEAVALGACHPVDVGLFDLRMPGRSGIEAAVDLFELAPTPIVLLTGVGSYDLPDPLPRPPIFAVLNKPVGLDELGVGLAKALEGFRGWVRNRDLHPGLGNGARSDRTLVASAVQTLADGGQRPAAASARLLQRARDENRSLVDVAREVLDTAPR